MARIAAEQRKNGPHAVIVGAGFGGLAAAETLGRAGVRTTVIDRQNCHVFVPLTYQVASGGLSPSDVAEPVRRLLRRYDSIDVVLGEVTGVDEKERLVKLADGGELSYDYLLLAAGSDNSYFGNMEWKPHAPGLKSLDDASAIRSRILLGLEEAEKTTDPEERERLMTTVIIGGSTTGIEIAGALAELLHRAVKTDFRHIDCECARIIVLEAAPTLLPGMPEKFAKYAKRVLERMGVEIRTETPVDSIDEKGVVAKDERIEAQTVIWGAGIAARPVAGWIGAETGKGGKIKVEGDLSVPGHDRIFALGDVAHFEDEEGNALPPLAQVAKQQGKHLGKALARYIETSEPLTPFRFKSRGQAAIVGRNAAFFHYGRMKLTGWFAWFSWALIHIFLLVSLEKRVLVSMQWAWRYLTYQHSARLIGSEVETPGRG